VSLRFIRSLDAEARREAEEQTFSLWSEGRSGGAHLAYQEEQLTRATSEILSYAGLVDSAGKLRASLKRFSLAMQKSGETHRAIGLGAVMVPEADRKKGFGRELIEAALDDARSDGARLAWLFSEIDPTYYERLGFVRVEWPIFACAVGDLPRATALHAISASPAGQSDLSLANELDERRYATAAHILRPARSISSRAYFAWRNDIETIWFAGSDGAHVGYISIAGATSSHEARKDTLEVADWAFDGVTRDAELALLRSLAEARGASFVAGTLGVDAVDERFTRFSSDAHGIPMLRSLDRRYELPADSDGRISATQAHFGLSDYF
jgi:predicted N-acetyltransferase YhbS